MRKAFVFLGLFSFLAGCSLVPLQPLAQQNPDSSGLIWQQVEDGLAYAQIDFTLQDAQNAKEQQRNLVVVRIDPKKFHFQIYQNKDLKTAKSIQDIYKEQQASVVFNGAFFSEDFKPLGYLKSGKNEIYKLSKSDLFNGVFAVFESDQNNQGDQGGHGALFDSSKFVSSDQVIFAVQNGPVLLDDQGTIKIMTDTGKLASRTALGLDKDGNIVVMLLQQSLFNTDNTLTLYQFAHLLKENSVLQNLGLHAVLNLDGGPSSGLMVDGHYYAEMNKVQNIITVTH